MQVESDDEEDVDSADWSFAQTIEEVAEEAVAKPEVDIIPGMPVASTARFRGNRGNRKQRVKRYLNDLGKGWPIDDGQKPADEHAAPYHLDLMGPYLAANRPKPPTTEDVIKRIAGEHASPRGRALRVEETVTAFQADGPIQNALQKVINGLHELEGAVIPEAEHSTWHSATACSARLQALDMDTLYCAVASMNLKQAGAVTDSFKDADATRDIHNELYAGIFQGHLEKWLAHLQREGASVEEQQRAYTLLGFGKIWAVDANNADHHADLHRRLDRRAGEEFDAVVAGLKDYVAWAKSDAGAKTTATHQSLILAKDLAFVALQRDCIGHGHGLGIITTMTATLSIHAKRKLGVGETDNLEVAHADTKRENINILNFLRGMKGFYSRNQITVILYNMYNRRLPVTMQMKGKMRTADIEQIVHLCKEQLGSSPTEAELLRVGAVIMHLAEVKKAGMKGWGLKAAGGRSRADRKESARLVALLAAEFCKNAAVLGDGASAIPSHAAASNQEVVCKDLEKVRAPWSAAAKKLPAPTATTTDGVRPQSLRALREEVLVPHHRNAGATAFANLFGDDGEDIDAATLSVNLPAAVQEQVLFAMAEGATIGPDEAANCTALQQAVRQCPRPTCVPRLHDSRTDCACV